MKYESRKQKKEKENMLVQVLKSKLHCVHVTEANLNYVGSVTIDKTLMEAVNILPGERVQIVNNNNGERFETYVIEGPADTGVICLNGAAARLCQQGDVVIIMAYAWMDMEEARTFRPALAFPDQNNRITKE